MILHTVNKSPFTSECLASCLRFAAPGDVILLLEDGVYAASRGADCGLEQHTHVIYAIAADVKARGLDERLRDDVEMIGYEAFVALCTRFDVIKNWS